MAKLSEDGRSVHVKASHEQRAALCASKPETFYLGDNRGSDATVAVRLARVERGELWDLLVTAWRQSAPPSLVRSVDPPTPRP